jgi:hypothetical protein
MAPGEKPHELDSQPYQNHVIFFKIGATPYCYSTEPDFPNSKGVSEPVSGLGLTAELLDYRNALAWFLETSIDTPYFLAMLDS